MNTRLKSSAIIWTATVLIIATLGIHGAIFLLALISYFSQLELYQMFEKMGLRPMKQIGLICGSALIFGSYYFGSLEAGENIFLISFLGLILLIARVDVQEGRFKSLLPTLFGFIYIPYLLHFLIKLYHLNILQGNDSSSSIFLGLWVIAIAINTDIGGYIFGKIIGKTKFSIVSPNKTYEGAVGGVLFSVSASIAILLIFPQYAPSQLNPIIAILITIPISLASIASDLIESAFKRQANQKDSSNIIPGVGGVFDLSDSIILTAPLAYLLIKFFVF